MRVRSLAPGALLILVGGISCSAPSGTTSPPGDPSDPSGSVKVGALYKERAVSAGGLVTASDDDGRPRFIWASRRPAASPNSTPEQAAREHFTRFAPAYGLEGGAAANVEVGSISRTRRGDYLVRLTQKVDGVDVYRSEVKVVMQSDLALIALSGTPSLGGAKPADAAFRIAPGQALSRALSHLYGVAVPDAATSSARAVQGSETWLELPQAGSVQLSEPARARKVLYRSGDRLIAAYFMEFFSSNGPSTSSDAYSYVVAAGDGRVLEQHNLTSDAAFNYRVFAEATPEGRPLDGPIADFTPHPAGEPDGSDPAFVLPALVSMESFKTEPTGVVDPWLAATAVQTLGNNVDAYADIRTPDGYSNGDQRATTTSPGTFDRTYLTGNEPGSTGRQIQASTTNLFYMINWMHDFWYDSGFTEAAGNAQMSNFGRGGVPSDPIHGEAQDFGGINNANMSTPSDGLSPRMQMYLWTAPSARTLTIEPGDLDLVNGSAAFGPAEFDLTDDVVLGDDGAAPNSDACTPLVNDVAGRIVLVDRGVCGFAVKAANAEAAGAVGVLVANNVAGPPPTMGNSTPPTIIAIPAQSVTLDDGNALKALLTSGPVTAHMLSAVLGPGRDGSIDNMIVAHEWGHYFHHRLTQCGSTQCGAMSEGWGDFQALMMVLRDGDDLDGTFGAAIYAPKVFGDSGYFGIRRFPYSVDFTRNALSFRHIQQGEVLPSVPSNGGGDNSEVHNAGEVWASMLFQAYVELQKNPGERTFDEVRRAFGDYLVLGLQLAPIDATFTETRDAILSAASILGPDDMTLLAQAFARRGAGSCAVSPDREAGPNLAPVTESFDVSPSIQINSIEIDDSVDTCDLDGILDGGETGQVVVEVGNIGPAMLIGSVVTLSSTTAGVSFPDGASESLDDVAAFGTQSVTINVALDESITEIGVLDLTVTVENPTACVDQVAETLSPRINADEIAQSTATEDVEASDPPWTKTGDGAEAIWTRAAVDASNHVWHGNDSGAPTDTQLVSPALAVSDTADFQITFDHAHSFEADTIFWDGGVIEISTDDGASWTDVSVYTDPGYNATITDTSGNVLGGRLAYGATNPSFPESDTVTLNLGTALAGQSVMVRFRIGTDAAVGAPGWTIDNLVFAGITNTPFTTVVPHAGNCQEAPVANAGADRTVASGADVILNGSGSSDPNGDPMTFAWTQTAGTPVTLINANTANAAFQAPEVTEDAVLTFQVEVSDATGSSTDTVDITVSLGATGGDDGSGDDGAGDDGSTDDGDGSDDGSDDGSNDGIGGGPPDDGGCAAAGGSGSTSFPAAMLLGLAFVAMRRRRK